MNELLRNIVKFQLKDEHGKLMKPVCMEMPRPGETKEQLLERLKNEFGDRLVLGGCDEST
jgi:hypothetical protein